MEDEIIERIFPSEEKSEFPQDAPRKPNLRHILREVLVCTLQVVILTFIIINYIGRVSVVQGQSMYPSLSTNNRIIVNLFQYRFSEPRRGDIVVFPCPIDGSKDYIKRVIGLPGEEIEIINGRVIVNGRALQEPYLIGEFINDNMDRITLDSDQIFVLGDNRINSEDSRTWGPVNRKFIKGRAVMIFWPIKSFHLLSTPAIKTEKSAG